MAVDAVERGLVKVLTAGGTQRGVSRGVQCGLKAYGVRLGAHAV